MTLRSTRLLFLNVVTMDEIPSGPDYMMPPAPASLCILAMYDLLTEFHAAMYFSMHCV